MPPALNLFAPITKVDAAQRLVYGVLAAEEVDKSGEIFDYATSKPLVEEWSGGFAKATDGKSVGNLRAMHNKIAAGKFTQLVCNDVTKAIDVCAHVVDDAEWTKVQEGVYTGFSIGGSYVKRWKDGEHTRYTAAPSEGSLVDNPCAPSAMFSMVKADGSTEMRKFHVPSPETAPAAAPPAVEPPPELEQVWKAKDGSTYATKALAKQHNEEVDAKAAAAKAPANQLTSALAQLGDVVTKAESAAVAPPAATVAKKDFTDDERKAMADKGEAMPGGGFPIASKADLENAIKAFGRAKNKKATKTHILARAKALGAEDALPDSWKPGADKAVRFGDLQKGLGTVARFAYLLQELNWLQEETEYEAAGEQDNSTVPATLKQQIATLAATLRAMCEEETNELLDNDEALEFGDLLEMSAAPRGLDALTKAMGGKSARVGGLLAKAGMRHGKADAEHLAAAHDAISAMGIAKCSGMGKAGARHSKADAQHLLDAHNSLCKAGAECPAKDAKDAPEAADDEEAEKLAVAPLTKALNDERAKTAGLEKTITGAVETIQALVTRVQKLEQQPVARPHERAPDPRYTVVNKGEDDATAALAQLTEAAKTDPHSIAKALIALSHEHPHPFR